MNHFLKRRRYLFVLLFGFLALSSCQILNIERSTASPTPLTIIQTLETGSIEFTQAEVDTLNSLQKVDDHPLYVMIYTGPYREANLSALGANNLQQSFYEDKVGTSTWACSLFAALADPQMGLLGRNFDWEFSPGLLLFTNPPDGYASVSIVDLAYFFNAPAVTQLVDLNLTDRSPLLNTPSMPFDGMNEKGLAIGMAAVPQSPTPSDPKNESVGSLRIIRMILDHAASVEEALKIMESVNILWDGGPQLHYLIADASGKAALVEFVDGGMIVLDKTNPWHLATNFLLSKNNGATDGICNRYDMLTEELQDGRGHLSLSAAMELLSDVSQSSTQWSVVYQFSIGQISLAMGRNYAAIHTFHLDAP